MDETDLGDTMSIGQFARATGLSVSAVRFYANRSLLKPAAVDARTGYRRYGASQVTDGALIRDLRRLDMPLALIERALEVGPDDRHRLVTNYIEELVSNVRRVRTLARSMGATAAAVAAREEEPTMTPQPHTSTSPSSPISSPGSASMAARALSKAIAQVLPVAGTDPAAPHLMTLLFEASDGSLRIVGTDRHRLAVRDLVPARLDADVRVVLAASTAADWATRLDVDGEATVTVTETSVELSGAVHAEAPLVPATYPDYQPVLDMPAGTTSILADAAALSGALPAGSDPVMITFDSTGASVGEAVAVPTQHAGPAQTILINAAYLRDALTATVGNEVVIDISDPLAPLVIRSADDGTFTVLVMPIAPE